MHLGSFVLARNRKKTNFKTPVLAYNPQRSAYSYLLSVYLSQVFQESLHELKDKIYNQFKRCWRKGKNENGNPGLCWWLYGCLGTWFWTITWNLNSRRGCFFWEIQTETKEIVLILLERLLDILWIKNEHTWGKDTGKFDLPEHISAPASGSFSGCPQDQAYCSTWLCASLNMLFYTFTDTPAFCAYPDSLSR